jgi:penicillin amidase
MRWLLAGVLLLGITVGVHGQDTVFAKAKAVLAQLEGEIAIPGLKEPVEVLRDRWGVPHIYAKSVDDLFFAQGFVAAQDRLFQLEMWRRLGNGETAEIYGPEAIEVDRFARLIRYRGDMDAEWASYSPDTKQIATAYTRGINAYIDHIGKKLPIEFDILGIVPKKWRPEDILTRMSGIIMSRNFQTEIARAQLIHAVGVEKARWLAPTDPKVDYAPAPGLDLAGIDERILAGYNAVSKVLNFKPPKTESNNWVVAGKRSLSGKPLLASDPHRAITVPSLRYLVHLNAPGWNVIGAGEPALPGVALGHNERIAWGITIIGTDQADIYVEEINPKNRDEYKVGERWEKVRVIMETLPLKGKEADLALRFTRHGPILYQDDKTNRAFALKWSGSEPGGAAYLGGLAVSRAANKSEFLNALRSWKIPGLNFVYADKDDNIGWVANALTPIKKHDGLLPVPGKGGYEWDGFLAVKDLPQNFNPKRGWLATANHKILYEGYKNQIAYEFAPSYRFDRIQQTLDSRDKWALKDFQALQHDAKSIPALRLAALLKKIDLRTTPLGAHQPLLTEWDGVLSRDAKAGPIYAAWLSELQDALYGAHVPKKLVPTLRTLSGVPVLLHALENPDKNWFGDNPIDARDKMLTRALGAAITKLDKDYAKPAHHVPWGKVHTATFKHALAPLDPAYGKAFNIGPLPRPGDVHTVNNTRHDEQFHQLHGASYRELFDLADWDRGLATSAPGQSGQPGSPHYADLAPLWAEGQYFPLAYSRAKVEEVTRHRLKLKPVAR